MGKAADLSEFDKEQILMAQRLRTSTSETVGWLVVGIKADCLTRDLGL